MDTKAPNIALKVEGDPLSAAKSVIRTNEKYNVAESKSPSPWRPLGSSFLFDDKKIREHESEITTTNDITVLPTKSITTKMSSELIKNNDNNIKGNGNGNRRPRIESDIPSTIHTNVLNPISYMTSMSSPDSRCNSRGGVSDALGAILDKYQHSTTIDLDNYDTSNTTVNTNITNKHSIARLDEFKQVSDTKNISPLKIPNRSSRDNAGVNKVTNRELNKSNLLYRMTAIGPKIKRTGSMHIAGNLCNKGLVSSRVIKPGECVFSETALLSVPCDANPEYLLSSIQFQIGKFTKKHSKDVAIMMSLETSTSVMNNNNNTNSAAISVMASDDDASINSSTYIEHDSIRVISRSNSNSSIRDNRPSATLYAVETRNDNDTSTFADATITFIPSTPIPPTPGKFPNTPGHSITGSSREMNIGLDIDNNVTATASSAATVTSWSSFSSTGMLSPVSPKAILRNDESEQRVLEILKEHGVAYANSDKQAGLWGLFPKKSRVRHCCAPNLEIQLHSNGVCTAYASRTIKAGEELTCNLLDDLYETYTMRQQQYCSKFFISRSAKVCCCFVCTLHDPADDNHRRSVVPHKIATKAVLPLFSLDEGIIGRVITLRGMIESLEQLIVDDHERDLFPRDIRQLRDLHVKVASLCMKLSEIRPEQGADFEGLRHLTLAGGYSALCVGWNSAETLRITKIINRNRMSACPIKLLPIFAKTHKEHRRWGRENEGGRKDQQQMRKSEGRDINDQNEKDYLPTFFSDDYTWDHNIEEFSTYSRSMAEGTGTVSGTSLVASIASAESAAESAAESGASKHRFISDSVQVADHNINSRTPHLNLHQLQLPQMSPLNTPTSITPRAPRLESDSGLTSTGGSKLFVNVNLIGSSQSSSVGIDAHGDTVSEASTHLSDGTSLRKNLMADVN